MFESTYSFDLEPVKKQNISVGIKQLERLGGTTPFSLAYVTQVALGGHAIPLDRGALDVLAILGVISEAEAQSGKVSGLERVIPKTKGVEFGSLLHHLAAEYVANPFSPSVRKLMLTINPDAKDRFPKRGAKKDDAHEEARSARHHADEHSAKKHAADAKGKHAAEKPANEKPAAKGSAVKEAEKAAEKTSGKSIGKPAEKPVEKSAEKSTEKPSAKAAEKSGRTEKGDKHSRPPAKVERAEPKKSTAGSGKHTDGKHSDSKHRAAAKAPPVAAKHKSASKQLSKRKPR